MQGSRGFPPFLPIPSSLFNLLAGPLSFPYGTAVASPCIAFLQHRYFTVNAMCSAATVVVCVCLYVKSDMSSWLRQHQLCRSVSLCRYVVVSCKRGLYLYVDSVGMRTYTSTKEDPVVLSCWICRLRSEKRQRSGVRIRFTGSPQKGFP